jgi:hypothetical protein
MVTIPKPTPRNRLPRTIIARISRFSHRNGVWFVFDRADGFRAIIGISDYRLVSEQTRDQSGMTPIFRHAESSRSSVLRFEWFKAVDLERTALIETAGALDAKTHSPRLLEPGADGAEFMIAERGEAIARLASA